MELEYATPKQKIWLACILAVGTIVLLIIGNCSLQKLEESWQGEISVEWKKSEDIILKPGPVSFWYDREKQLLIHRGQVNDEVKESLLALIETAERNNEPNGSEEEVNKANSKKSSAPSRVSKTNDHEETAGDTRPVDFDSKKVVRSYYDAINELAYISNAMLETSLMYLLLLAGLGGSLGVQIRSISNFIGVACIKNQLDIKRWWPWYALRPLLGFLLGVLIVILVKARLFLMNESAPESNLWWLGLSVLVGFGASDFTERLRLLSHTLFGKSS